MSVTRQMFALQSDVNDSLNDWGGNKTMALPERQRPELSEENLCNSFIYYIGLQLRGLKGFPPCNNTIMRCL